MNVRKQPRYIGVAILPILLGGMAVFLFAPVAGQSQLEPVVEKAFVFRSPEGYMTPVVTTVATVGQFLQEYGIEVGPEDIIVPAASEPIPVNGEVKLIKVSHSDQTSFEEIPYSVVLRPDPKLAKGREIIVTKGVSGLKEVTYRDTRENGVISRREITAEETVHPACDQVSRVGSKVAKVVAPDLIAGDVIWMEATAYDPGFASNGKWTGHLTAYGLKPGFGIVAVDPRVIPLGTSLYIENYGYAIAGDTGGAIKGYRIDLGYNTQREAIKFGRREVKVYVLKDKV